MVKIIRDARLTEVDMQQLVWETEPSHSLSAQMLMIYSFVLPKLSAHAIKLVMGLMHYDELRRMASTRRALAGAPGPIKLVPPMKRYRKYD